MNIVNNILTLVLTALCANADPDLLYRYTTAFNLIWNDKGSGGDNDAAFWRVQNTDQYFCSIGDVVTRGYKNELATGLLVASKIKKALIRPTSFTEVWNDKGSGSDGDVAIYRMNAPSGYTCLGEVAVGSYNKQPDKSKYCCVKNDYIVRGFPIKVYTDEDSDANQDINVFQIIRNDGDSTGLYAKNFVSTNNYRTEPSQVFLLKEGEKVQDDFAQLRKQKPINLHEVPKLNPIWTDKGSGADRDVSIWRAKAPSGYYSVGDIVVGSYVQPARGFLLKPNDSSIVSSPTSYLEIWSDKGSGADQNVKLWRPLCNGGYVPLGEVATNGARPKIGDIYCIKSEYTVLGSRWNWAKVWTDKGSGADRDVQIFEARSTNSNQQSVRGFGAVASKHGIPRPPFLLRKEAVTYWAEKPIKKIWLSDVRMLLHKEKTITEPIAVSPTVMKNPYDIEFTPSAEISYEISESKTFEFSQSFEIGIEVEISGGIPFFAKSTTTMKFSSTTSFTTGKTETKTKMDKRTATVKLPPYTKVTAFIKQTEYKADIPFEATIKKEYQDETFGTGQVSGIFKGVLISKGEIGLSEKEDYQVD